MCNDHLVSKFLNVEQWKVYFVLCHHKKNFSSVNQPVIQCVYFFLCILYTFRYLTSCYHLYMQMVRFLYMRNYSILLTSSCSPSVHSAWYGTFPSGQNLLINLLGGYKSKKMFSSVNLQKLRPVVLVLSKTDNLSSQQHN